MKSKKAIVGVLISESVAVGNKILDIISRKGAGIMETIRAEVFPKIQFPSSELFLRAYQFSQQKDIERGLKESYITEDKKDSCRRRRYRRLYRIHSMLRDFALLDRVDMVKVVIPFSCKDLPGSLLMLDQEGGIWVTSPEHQTPPVYHHFHVHDRRCSLYYLYNAFTDFPRNLIGGFERAMECNPTQVDRDLKALSR